jgi:hypothetical protein
MLLRQAKTHPFPSPAVNAIPIEEMSALRDTSRSTLFQTKRTRPAGSNGRRDRLKI